MKELDVVRLKETYKNIKPGTIGTIVYIYDDKMCEVEFIDDKQETIDVITVPLNIIELL